MQLRSFARSCGVVGCVGLVLLGAGCRGGGRRPEPAPAADPTALFGDPSAPIARAPDAADSDSPTGVSCNHEYYPLRLGYHIQYKVTFPPIGGRDTAYYAMRVMSVNSEQVQLQVDYDLSGDRINTDLVYKCIDGSLQAAGYVNTGSLVTGGADMNRFRVRTDGATGQFLPPRIARGDTWTSSFNAKVTPLATEMTGEPIPADAGGIREPISMPISITRTALGIEQVTVPAGRFEAMKIKAVTSFDGVPTMSGTEWWVKDVGMVKSTYDGGSGVENIVTVARGVTVPGHIDIPSAEITP